MVPSGANFVPNGWIRFKRVVFQKDFSENAAVYIRPVQLGEAKILPSGLVIDGHLKNRMTYFELTRQRQFEVG